MKQLSPTQRARLDEWFEGPRSDETENQFVARMNATLTDSDRAWIVEFMDDYNEKKAKSVDEPLHPDEPSEDLSSS